jgi:hypothetical protein
MFCSKFLHSLIFYFEPSFFLHTLLLLSSRDPRRVAVCLCVLWHLKSTPPPLPSLVAPLFLCFLFFIFPSKGVSRKTISKSSRSLLPSTVMPSSADALHPASLVSASRHNPYLLDLIRGGVSVDMISYIARTVEQVIAIEGESTVASAGPSLPTPPQTPHKSSPRDQRERVRSSAPQIISLEHFIFRIVQSANVQVPTLLTTLIYLERLRLKLPAMAKGQLPYPCSHILTAIYIF